MEIRYDENINLHHAASLHCITAIWLCRKIFVQCRGEFGESCGSLAIEGPFQGRALRCHQGSRVSVCLQCRWNYDGVIELRWSTACASCLRDLEKGWPEAVRG